MEPPPEPPPPAALDPATRTWSAGRRLYRVHDASPANAFNPGYGCGRFHPIRDSRGEPIPTLYAADQIAGALSESVFRGVRASGGRIHRADLEPLRLSRLVLEADLRLVDLTGLALRRLGLTRAQLIEAPEWLYRSTARWAEALHEADSTAQGLLWVSRQCDTARVVVLFGDRVDASRLRPDGPAEALHRGPGFQRVCEAAGRANIAVIQ
jgi:hypothetical protein